jgi:hemoglobin
MKTKSVPTLYEWIGGETALKVLTGEFYNKVRKDDILAPVFSGMSPEHPEHVAAFIGEVFGGPKTYSESHGGHDGMIRRHMHRSLTETQRRRWVSLLLDTYEDLGLPNDPEFMSAVAGYLEWGSRLAVLNSQPGVSLPQPGPMPKWGWGEVGAATAVVAPSRARVPGDGAARAQLPGPAALCSFVALEVRPLRRLGLAHALEQALEPLLKAARFLGEIVFGFLVSLNRLE